MIELVNINRTYKVKGAAPVVGLKNVSLKLGKTGMVFIIGKSGSGKSTFLNVVGGLDKYDSGELLIKGKSTKRFKQSDFDSYRNTMIGFIFQEYNVLEDFSVARNISLALELQGKKATEAEINHIIEQVDLIGLNARKSNELSGGQNQRVAIARALVKDPEIIMADEPTGALDSVTGKQVLETLKNLSKTKLVLVVSHDREFALKFADRIIEFSDGEIISDTSLSNLATSHVSEGDFSFPENYVLSKEDLIKINKKLKTSPKPLLLAKTSPRDEGWGQTVIKEDELLTSGYHNIKSRLPFTSSLRIGLSTLKKKKFRLAMTFILASVAFSMFGISDALGSYNPVDVAIKSMKKENLNYLNLIQKSIYEDEKYPYYRNSKISDEDISSLNKTYKGNYYPLHLSTMRPYLRMDNLLFDYYINDRVNIYYPEKINAFELTEEIANDLNIVPLDGETKKSTYPTKINQIALTEYDYIQIKKYGLKIDDNKVNINSIDELLGMSIPAYDSGKYEIVGIFDTGWKYEKFNIELTQEQYYGIAENQKLIEEYRSIYTYSYHQAVFMSEKLIDAYADLNKQISQGELEKYLYLGEIDDPTIFRDIYNISNQRDNYNNGVVYLSGVDKNNLSDNDVIIDVSLIPSRFSSPVYDYQISDRINQVIEDNYQVSNSMIEDFIFNVYPSLNAEGKTESEKRQAVIELYNDIIFKDSPLNFFIDLELFFNHPISDTVFNSISNLLLANLNKATYPLKIVDYDGEESIRDINIVGIDFTKGNRGFYYFSDSLLSQINPNFKFGYNSLIVPLSSLPNQSIRSLVNLTLIENNKDETPHVTYEIQNTVITTIGIFGSIISLLAMSFLIVGIVFVLIASLLLINYISVSVTYKKKEIGILRALGARGKDVFSIFLNEALFVSLINAVVGIIASSIAVNIINNNLTTQFNLNITILNWSVRQGSLIILIAVFVGVLATFIPVTSTARKRPIDAIREN